MARLIFIGSVETEVRPLQGYMNRVFSQPPRAGNAYSTRFLLLVPCSFYAGADHGGRLRAVHRVYDLQLQDSGDVLCSAGTLNFRHAYVT